jgi:hypothetical protein
MAPTFPVTPKWMRPAALHITSSPVSERPAAAPASFTASAQFVPDDAVVRSRITPSRQMKAWAVAPFTSAHPTTVPLPLIAAP